MYRRTQRMCRRRTVIRPSVHQPGQEEATGQEGGVNECGETDEGEIQVREREREREVR